MRLVEFLKDGGGLSLEQKRKYVYDELIRSGMSSVQASAVLGNLMQENYTMGPTVENDSSGALGLHQVLGDRKKDLLNSYDDPYDFYNQVDFLVKEIFDKSKHPDSWRGTANFKRFMELDDLAQATKFFRTEFERPGEAEAHDSTRLKYATQILGTFGGTAYSGNNAPQAASTNSYGAPGYGQGSPHQPINPYQRNHQYIGGAHFDVGGAPNVNLPYSPSQVQETDTQQAEAKAEISQAQLELRQRNAEREQLLALVPQSGRVSAPNVRTAQLGMMTPSTTINILNAVNSIRKEGDPEDIAAANKDAMDKYKAALWNTTDRLENEGMSRDEAVKVAAEEVSKPAFMDIPSTITGISPIESSRPTPVTNTDDVNIEVVDNVTGPLVYTNPSSAPVLGINNEPNERVIGPREEFDTDGYAIQLEPTVAQGTSQSYTPFIKFKPEDFIVKSDAFERQEELDGQAYDEEQRIVDELMAADPNMSASDAWEEAEKRVKNESAFGDMGERCAQTAGGQCLSAVLNYEGSYLSHMLGVGNIRDDLDSIMNEFEKYSVASRSKAGENFAHNNSVDAWEIHNFLVNEKGYAGIDIPDDLEERKRVLYDLPIGTILGSGSSKTWYTNERDGDMPQHAVQIVGFLEDGTPLINDMGNIRRIDNYLETYVNATVPPQYEKYTFNYMTEGIENDLGLNKDVNIQAYDENINSGINSIVKDVARETGVPVRFLEKLSENMSGLLEQESDAGVHWRKLLLDNTVGNDYVKPAVKYIKNSDKKINNAVKRALGFDGEQEQDYKLYVRAHRKYPNDEEKRERYFNRLERRNNRKPSRVSESNKFESSYGPFSNKDFTDLMRKIVDFDKYDLQTGFFAGNDTKDSIELGSKLALIKLAQTAKALRQKYGHLSDKQLVDLTYVGYSNNGKILDEEDYVKPYIVDKVLDDNVLNKIKNFTEEKRGEFYDKIAENSGGGGW